MSRAIEYARSAYHFARKVTGREKPEPNPFPIDAWTDPRYQAWFEAHKATEDELMLQRQAAEGFAYKPRFSFIVPLYKTPLDYLKAMSDSVRNQTYGNLELVLVNASPEMDDLRAAVAELAGWDERVKVVELKANLGITENTNAGIEASTGDFCCFLDHDDFIEPDLLFEYVKALNENSEIDFLYCDEDLVLENEKTGKFRHQNPTFKVDYSPELLLCKNVIVHLMTVRRSVIDEMPERTAVYDGSQDYNMALFCTSRSRAVKHIAKVLYHWRISENSTATNPDSKPYSLYSCRRSQAEHFEREGIDAKIASSGLYLLHNPWFNTAGGAKVSVVVDAQPWVGEKPSPAARAYNRIDSFVEFFSQSNSYENVEVLLVGSGLEPERFAAPVRVVDCRDGDALYARLNMGAAEAKGEYLIFLDAGCVLETPGTIEQLVGLCTLDGVGVASPKTLYAGGRNKTFGVAVTSERIMPLYRGYEDAFPGYLCNTRSFQNNSACGLQGLTISRELFEHVGGFDEAYKGEIGAVDLCHRVLAEGLRVAQTCTVKLKTADASPENYFVSSENAPDYTDADVAFFDKKWPGVREAGDPYFNPNLDQSSGYCQVAK
jgi:GT2 family glycosyltransferase